MITVAFDIDDTLWKVRVRGNKGDQIPDYDLIQVLRWFYENGDKVIVWSAGGIDYALKIAEKLGIDEMVTVVEKGSIKTDIAFDDRETKLGKVDIQVKREPHQGFYS